MSLSLMKTKQTHPSSPHRLQRQRHQTRLPQQPRQLALAQPLWQVSWLTSLLKLVSCWSASPQSQRAHQQLSDQEPQEQSPEEEQEMLRDPQHDPLNLEFCSPASSPAPLPLVSGTSEPRLARAAFVASSFCNQRSARTAALRLTRGAFPPVEMRAVCLVLAIVPEHNKVHGLSRGATHRLQRECKRSKRTKLLGQCQIFK